jgi:hypothetical protein
MQGATLVVMDSSLLCQLTCCLAAIIGVGCRQPDADSAFINLEAQAALFVIVGLLAQLRELDGIGQQPILQVDIVGVDLCGGVTVMSKNLSNSYHC